MSRALLIVLDSLGVGAMPDAEVFCDSKGCNTLAHVIRCHPDPDPFPNLKKLGFTALAEAHPCVTSPARLAKLREASNGKDTVVGHWELVGVISEKPFPVYPEGFPEDVRALVEGIFAKPVLGNIAASGTALINELGEAHLATGNPILYTSSDSVLQVAYHEGLMPPEKLHDKCAKIRHALMEGPHRVNRVIARPFIGHANGHFTRTSNRKDFTIPVPENNLLHDLLQAGIPISAVGKIKDIFPNVPFTTSNKITDNLEGMTTLREILPHQKDGLIFVNLVDFDMLYGHRRDCVGYAKALSEFDAFLPELLRNLAPGDLLILTADHGCDPTAAGSDHTREFVPFLMYAPDWPIHPEAYLGTRATFADCAATLARFFNLDHYSGAGHPIPPFDTTTESR